MLYLLLIIIAIGVLLTSEAGKTLLGWLVILTLVAGGLYLAFWIVVIAIGLFSNQDIRDDIAITLGTIMLILYACYAIYVVYKKYKKGDFKKAVLKSKAKSVWLEAGIGRKIAIVFIILTFSTIATLLAWSFTIKDFWQ